MLPAALFGVLACLLLRSAICQYSWIKLQMHDYGIYTNFLWNSAHGDWFRVLVDTSYLKTHLSFTLLLVAPLFRLVDHPLLLTVLQWTFGVVGGLLIAWSALRHGLSRLVAFSLAALLLGYNYTQSALLCEFHGVALYFVLIPWLFHTLSLSRRWAWLPLLLLLGLREDAGFVVFAFPLFFAIRDRWKMGYVYAALSIGYAVVAMKFLFPLLSGISLAQRRASLLGEKNILQSLLDPACGIERLLALIWALLPLGLVPPRAWKPALSFAAVPTLILMFSPEHHHHGLSRHYGAVPITAVALGLVLALAREPLSVRRLRILPGLAMLVLAISYLSKGSLPGGAEHCEELGRINREGLETAWAAGHLPKEGLLYADKLVSGFCANRADIISNPHYRPGLYNCPLVFCRTFSLNDDFKPALERGDFGVRFFDYHNLILGRGYSTNLNAEALREIHRPSGTALFFAAPAGGVFAPGCGAAMFWRGSRNNARRMPTRSAARLGPGRYKARIRLRAAEPAGSGGWGEIRIHDVATGRVLARADVDPQATPEGIFRMQEIPFEVTAEVEVNAEVIGQAAPLWLDRCLIDPVSAQN